MALLRLLGPSKCPHPQTVMASKMCQTITSLNSDNRNGSLYNAYGHKIKTTHLEFRTESKRREKRRVKALIAKFREGQEDAAGIAYKLTENYLDKMQPRLAEI